MTIACERSELRHLLGGAGLLLLLSDVIYFGLLSKQKWGRFGISKVEAKASGAWGNTTSGQFHRVLVQIEKLLRCRHSGLDCGSTLGRNVYGLGGLFQFVLDLENG